MGLPPLHEYMAGPPYGHGTRITIYNRVVRKLPPEFGRQKLRLERSAQHGFVALHYFPPFLHLLLRVLQERTLRAMFQQGPERLQRRFAIPDKSDFDGIPQPDSSGITVDLNAARLSWFR